MDMELYEHSRIAYEVSVQMLKDTGKEAVVHPTRIGKSFIAFHLCEKHPESKVCFLSPSEYIYKTQLGNWVVAGGKEPGNIVFYTYAKLLLMKSEEIA